MACKLDGKAETTNWDFSYYSMEFAEILFLNRNIEINPSRTSH